MQKGLHHANLGMPSRDRPRLLCDRKSEIALDLIFQNDILEGGDEKWWLGHYDSVIDL